MTTGLETTFRVLATTPNGAARPWLLRALGSPDPAVQIGAVHSILSRADHAGQMELLRRWDQLTEAQLHTAAEHPTRLSGVLRDGVLSGDPDFNRNACTAAVQVREYDLIPTLVRAAEDRSNPHAERAAETVVALAADLRQELSEPRDYRIRRDPALVRQFVYNSLEASVRHFGNHRRALLVEAFLLVAEKDEAVFKLVLNDPNEPAHNTLVALLSSSTRPGIIRLICEILEEPHASPAAVHIAIRRRDPTFLRALLRKAADKLSPVLQSNLRKVDDWVWLRDGLAQLQSLSDIELAGAVQLAVASSINRLQAFEVVKFALLHGGSASRRLAAAALAEFKGAEANDLVIQAVADPDPEVQAPAIAQLRERGIPNAMHKLIQFLHSPHEAVRAAVLAALGEFTFQRYLSAFEMLDGESRRLSGSLVKQIDPSAIPQLKAELRSASRTRRLRGIEIALAMQATAEVEPELLLLAADPDHFVRVATAEALGRVATPEAARVLRELCADRAISVQAAAHTALALEIPTLVTGPSAAGR